MPRTLRSPIICTSLILLLLAGSYGCGGNTDRASDRSASPPATFAPDAVAHPFAISPLPPEMRVTDAVNGTADPKFSNGTIGGSRPMLIIVPEDWSSIDDHRWIEVRSIDGSSNDGGFHQELPADTGRNSADGLFDADGHPGIRLSSLTTARGDETAAFVAINTSATTDEGLEGGDQRGVLVTGVPEDLDLFQEIAQAVTVDRWRTPKLKSMPDGWRVLGTLNASQVDGLHGISDPSVSIGQRTMLIRKPEGRAITVTAFAGDSSLPELKAIEAIWASYNKSVFAPVQQFKVDGQNAYLVRCCKAQRNELADLDATAWLSIDGVPFEVHASSTTLGTVDQVMEFAATIRLISSDAWTDVSTPITAPPGGVENVPPASIASGGDGVVPTTSVAGATTTETSASGTGMVTTEG